MTEKLGVLLVDVPGQTYWKYYCLGYDCETYNIIKTDSKEVVKSEAYKCTKDEAKNTHNLSG